MDRNDVLDIAFFAIIAMLVRELIPVILIVSFQLILILLALMSIGAYVICDTVSKASKSLVRFLKRITGDTHDSRQRTSRDKGRQVGCCKTQQSEPQGEVLPEDKEV